MSCSTHGCLGDPRMTNGTRNGLLIGSLVLAGGLLVLLVAGGVLGQTGNWTPTAMQGGMGGMMNGGTMNGGMGGGMMNGGTMNGAMMNGGMGNMDHAAMQARHAECQAAMANGNMTMQT